VYDFHDRISRLVETASQEGSLSIELVNGWFVFLTPFETYVCLFRSVYTHSCMKCHNSKSVDNWHL